MNPVIISLLMVIILSVVAFYIGQWKIRNQKERPHSLPHFYGWILSLSTFFFGVILFIIALKMSMPLSILPYFTSAISVSIAGAGVLLLSPHFQARSYLEKIVRVVLMSAAVIAIIVTAAIFFILLFESIHFFSLVPLSEFLFGLHWSPPSGLSQDAESVLGHYGVIPLLTGTLVITMIAMAIAVPLGLFIAVYTAEYATTRQRKVIKPLVEMLAGIPTIIYGFFALIAVAPLLHHFGQIVGLPIAAESGLGAGLVMGLMIIPFISSLSDDALTSIPRSLRENSWALGSTSSETILKVVIPAALPGIASAVLLAFSRAIGETMLVVMAAGLTAHLTLNPLHSVTTMTVQIVALLTGDQEFNSPKSLAAFALGLLLFLCTLILNIIALRIMRWHRERYAL